MSQPTYVQVDEVTARLTADQRYDVNISEFEALGYARGRVDAAHDHGLPWSRGLDPIDFSRWHAMHVAEHHDRYNQGRATMRKDIRSSWEAFVTR